MLLTLVPHPQTPAGTVDRVRIQLALDGSRDLWLEYSVTPAGGLLLPPAMAPGRADELWNATCFELFVQAAGAEGYLEFNFSPSFQWAAYRFPGYRRGRQDLSSPDPEIVTGSAGDHFFLAVEALPRLPSGPLRIGVAAVIEETDGTKSYWALAHPAAKPDFHHPASFVHELP